eukprot:1158189-Pelagomonas_calceolata.AAC.2
MEAVSEKFGADLSSPSRGAVALLSTLNAQTQSKKHVQSPTMCYSRLAQVLIGVLRDTPLCFYSSRSSSSYRERSYLNFPALRSDPLLLMHLSAHGKQLGASFAASMMQKSLSKAQPQQAWIPAMSIQYVVKAHSDARFPTASHKLPVNYRIPQGGGSHNVDSQPSPFKEIFLNAIPLERTGAVVPYPDAAIKKASQLQAALTVSYKELQGEQDYLERQKSTGAKKPDEDEMTLIEARLKVESADEALLHKRHVLYLSSKMKGTDAKFCSNKKAIFLYSYLKSVKELRQAMERRAAAEKLSQLQLDKKQHQALITAATSRVLVLTGAAGCGKTMDFCPCLLFHYATYAIVTYLKSLGSDMHLMAPTGFAATCIGSVTKEDACTILRNTVCRAASNMRSVTWEDASTIHSALRATPLCVELATAHAYFGLASKRIDLCLTTDKSNNVDHFRPKIAFAVGDACTLEVVFKI